MINKLHPITSRYFTEDIVPTPTIDALISQISTLSSETGAFA